MCDVHIALQELQIVVLMLYTIAFHLSGKVVALLLDNSASKVNFCNQGGIVSLIPSRLSCCIFNVAIKHNINLIPAYKPTHLNVEAHYLSQEKGR